MKVEVVIPAEYVGSLISEMNDRRGQFQDQEMRGTAVVVSAIVPLANMSKLEDRLRSRSEGQALLKVSYAGYVPVPLPDDRDQRPAMAMRA